MLDSFYFAGFIIPKYEVIFVEVAELNVATSFKNEKFSHLNFALSVLYIIEIGKEHLGTIPTTTQLPPPTHRGLVLTMEKFWSLVSN